MSSSYHCTIIIIIKSSYNHISMSPSYYRSSQHIISHQYEVMITYFQHKFLQLLCMKCHFHFIQSVCMSCYHLELHLFLVTFSNEFLLHGSKITENVVTILSICRQFNSENAKIVDSGLPQRRTLSLKLGLQVPRVLQPPYSVQIFNSTQSVEGFFPGSLLKNASWAFWSRKYSLKKGKCKCCKNDNVKIKI